MICILRLAAVLVVLHSLAVAGPAGASPADSLRLHGSNTVGQRLVPALVRAWAEARGHAVGPTQTAVAEEVMLPIDADGRTIEAHVHSHGTGTGFADLLAGEADFWMASRPINAAELARAAPLGSITSPGQEHVIALDGLAIIVHPANPISSLTVAQVRDAFAGRIRDWSELGGPPGPINLYARDDKSGTYDSFQAMVLRGAAISGAARRYESTDQLSADVVADPRGLGFVGLAGVGRAKALAVSDAGTRPLAPSRLTVGTEDYALARRLFLYNGPSASPLARDFIEFVLGPEGQRVVERIGYVSQDVVALAVPPREDAPEEYRTLVDGAQRLSLNFRFDAGTAVLDNKSLRDVARLEAFLRQPQNRGVDLILVGFADSSEINPYHALSLSTDRADFVATQLIPRGVTPRRVRGVGGVAPVAAEDSEYGRAKNRRVEVWVRPRAEGTAGGAASGRPTG
jgi:phosphate transport system substrate-binding protein